MWKCSKCGTINNGNFCTVCGTEKPIDFMMPPQDFMTPSQEPKKRKNKVLVPLIIIASVLVLSLLLGSISFCAVTGGFSGGQESAEEEVTDEPAEEATEEATEEAGDDDGQIKEITDIDVSYKTYGDIVTIKTSSKANPDVEYLKNPDRVVLDFDDFTQVIGGTQTGQSGKCIDNIRYANHATYARVVIDLSQEADYTVKVYEDECVVRIIEK